MRRYRKAVIVATLGPASSDPAMIRRLFEAGVDVFRLNFSHGSRDDHKRRFDIIRALEAELNHPIGILQDLQGPKIRVGTLAGGSATIAAGDLVTFDREPAAGDGKRIPLLHPEVFSSLLPGHRLLIDDGKLQLDVKTVTDEAITARVVTGGIVSDRKGINLPDTDLPISPLTAKDKQDLEFGLKLGVDWVALSFVQRPSDVLDARTILKQHKSSAGLMVKIEKPAALLRIVDIISLADAVMVARGDLGVEIPPEDVPGRQKELVRLCREAGKPVVIATQMLESMIRSPTPTRAEASDVATAIFDGADAVMLSAESASGQYPLEAVAMMDRIISHTEEHSTYRSILDALEPSPDHTVPHAVAAAAADVADAIGAAVVVAFTASGTTATRIARKRPRVQILSVSPDLAIARRLAVLWGTHSIASQDISSYDEMVEVARQHSISQGFAKSGDHIVVIAGVPFGQPGTTNNLRVVTV
ncbi:MAG: pyruvate kinase [Hyphomicrobiaceae bacterium]|nr:MAG: pyruvate kinase [Hyphomicrobiaceae bacterium]